MLSEEKRFEVERSSDLKRKHAVSFLPSVVGYIHVLLDMLHG